MEMVSKYFTAYGNGRPQIFGRVATDRSHCLAAYGNGRPQIFGRVATDRSLFMFWWC
ncbi:MAG: hypothetical protein M3N42_10925 [Cyanobacteriota bacterium]|nr:hypothetical protein [Cyanobacteriota bacterium]